MMNLKQHVPHIVNRPNRPDPSPRMTRPFAAAAMALLLTIAGIAPGLAESAGDEMRGFGNVTTGTVIVVASFDASGIDNGLAMNMLDDRMVEDSFGGMVIESQRLTPSMARGVGVDDGHMFGLMMPDFTPALLIIVSADNTVYMLMQAGDDLDGDLMAHMTRDVVANGLDDLSAPRGYIDVPLDNTTADDPFDGFELEGI